jgi:ComF family protein
MGDMEVSGDEKPICAECKANPPCFKSGMSCWLHKGVGRDIILTLKYRNADFLKNDIATLLKRYCGEVCEFVENSLLVPVPTPYFRRVKRGYNQAEVIAYAVAKIVNNASVVNMLRSKGKQSQTKLKRDERLVNAKGVFECSVGSEGVPQDSRIVIVDDVSTTGATVNECCRILQEAGFDNLHVLTLSYG